MSPGRGWCQVTSEGHGGHVHPPLIEVFTNGKAWLGSCSCRGACGRAALEAQVRMGISSSPVPAAAAGLSWNPSPTPASPGSSHPQGTYSAVLQTLPVWRVEPKNHNRKRRQAISSHFRRKTAPRATGTQPALTTAAQGNQIEPFSDKPPPPGRGNSQTHTAEPAKTARWRRPEKGEHEGLGPNTGHWGATGGC